MTPDRQIHRPRCPDRAVSRVIRGPGRRRFAADYTVSPTPGEARLAEEPTASLLRRAQEGDARALGDLIAKFRPRLQRWVHGRLPTHARTIADTDDVVQETLIRTVRNLSRFEVRNDGGLDAYFRRALLNRVREEIRRRQTEVTRRDDLPDEQADDAPTPIESVLEAEAHGRYEAGLAQLEEDERLAIIGRLELGYTFAEVASLIGKRTPDAARKHTTRALRKLAERMCVASA